MRPDIERARQELAVAREMSERLWAEYRAYLESLLPERAEATPEAMRRMHEASAWTRKIYAAEQSVSRRNTAPPGIVGSHGEYQWLSMEEQNISTLLSLCPDVVIGKYLAVTSIDSGTLRLTEQERNYGWWTSEAGKVFSATSWSGRDYRDGGKVAYSTRVTSIHSLPNETHDECCGGYSEWYIFEQPVEADEMEVFVNWMGFALYDAPYKEWADRCGTNSSDCLQSRISPTEPCSPLPPATALSSRKSWPLFPTARRQH